MRAVALADETVQQKIEQSFVPLEVAIEPGTATFPIPWPAMRNWRLIHWLMGGAKCQGITGCAIVSPNLEVQLGNTGAANVWDMFDSIAYDAEKFATMLDTATAHWQAHRQLLTDPKLREHERTRKLMRWRIEVGKQVRQAGRSRGKPRGYSMLRALELFRLTGDWQPGGSSPEDEAGKPAEPERSKSGPAERSIER